MVSRGKVILAKEGGFAMRKTVDRRRPAANFHFLAGKREKVCILGFPLLEEMTLCYFWYWIATEKEWPLLNNKE